MKYAAVFMAAAGLAWSQASTPAPVKIGDVTVTASLRTRVEMWDWFDGGANSDYAFSGSTLRLGFGQQKKSFEWLLEFEAPILLGLPDDAIAPGNQGQLGAGANYFAANHERNSAMIFAKQGFLRWKGETQSLKIGRMEFIDGTEVAPKDPTLAALKRDRIAHRLIGNFAFSHVGRSFDGAQYVAANRKLNFTLLAARPTRGVYQVDGWGELNINVLYGALTGQVTPKRGAGEWRVLGLYYDDGRDVLKVDNRPVALRRADLPNNIRIGTFGGHYLHTVPTGAGSFDLLLWGVGQVGSWGNQSQRAGAFAAEAGWQPMFAKHLRPWIRGGYNYGSGDSNPLDGTHSTFFQVLPTPRGYARTPFYNQMNARHPFGELILRPAKSLTLRTDVHYIALDSANDLWYLGGGAFQPWSFGYQGRTGNGKRSLGTLYDISADYSFNARVSTTAYFGHVTGHSVMKSIFPNGANCNFGYLELTYKF